MKKQLLIVAHHMTIGGVQKTLISAAKALDYEKYDVTLYLRKNRTDLLEYIDKRVNVIVNTDPNRYYRKPYALILQFRMLLNKILGRKEKAEALENELSDKIREDSMRYEQKAYFSSKKYDVAIAYVQGYTALFVDKFIDADEKIIFFHTSVDELHNMHESILPDFKKIAALHDEQKEFLGNWYPEEKSKITVVENYTDRDLIAAQSRNSSIEFACNKTVLCSCGRFTPVKGFDLAVESAKLLSNKGVDFIWYFVGDGPEKEKLKALVEEYSLSDKIVFTGMQKNPYPYMASCDIYVQPSYEEAMPVTIIEALRLDRPIITTATVGGKKLVKDGCTGLVCDINAESLAKSIEKLINDKQAYNDIVKNLKTIDYSHEFEKYKEQWNALLKG